MALKTSQHVIKGMLRDLSVSKFSPEFAFDALNIRITARDNNTLLSVTNEKGTKAIVTKDALGTIVNIDGVLIGYNVLNNYLTLFTKGNTDNIYRLEYKDNYFETLLLFSGNLNFSIDYPIENISVYENDNIQKVYWVDGLNLPRVINIVASDDVRNKWVNHSFNFIPEVSLKESITIKTNNIVSGQFPSGIVLYVFSYYNLYGSESNIVYLSPLYYSHAFNRGGSPEETGSNSFDIEINNSDKNFDYIRIYSITRTSIDSTPTLKIVADLKVSDSTIYYTDNNTTGENIDSTVLLYLGGENIIPSTMTQKDNTLFLGNYKLSSSLFSSESRNNVKGSVSFSHKILNTNESVTNVYNYYTLLDNNSFEITSLKGHEIYRFGVLFQNKAGKWSEVLWVGDSEVSLYPDMSVSILSPIKLYLNKASYTIPQTVIQEAVNKGYVKARGMIVYPNNSDKSIICQGVLCPTLYNAKDRTSNSPYSVSSWFFRPFVNETTKQTTDEIESKYGNYASYKDSDGINPVYPKRSTEIGTNVTSKYSSGETEFNDYFVDSNIVTMHSPDVEFGDINVENKEVKCRLIGSIKLESGVSYRSITTDTIGNTPTIDSGFYNRFPSYLVLDSILYNIGGRMLLSGVHWMGTPLVTQDTTEGHLATAYNFGWLVSPWQRTGSLINDFRYSEITLSKLKSNKLSNLRSSQKTFFKLTDNIPTWEPPSGISNVTLFDSNEISLKTIMKDGNSLVYYGNVDKIIPPGHKEDGTGSEIGLVPTSLLSGQVLSLDSLYKGEIQNTTFFSELNVSIGTYTLKNTERFSNSPVRIKYKSGKHLLFGFKNYNGNRVLLPNNNGFTETGGVITPKYPHTIDLNAVFEYFDAAYSGLWLAELTKEVSESSRFGGNTEEALLNNKWNIGGNSIPIVNDLGNPIESTIEYLQGDTYLQRYDCLKTYPYTNEDENSVSEIVSFYCETFINIDGRYDKNRGNPNNLVVSPANFNLYNKVYSLRNNYFNYQYLNELSKLDYFPNSILWTKEKLLGELIDTWTSITGTSTLDLDGDKGEVVSLNTYNNEIFCFQKKGLSNILFNSRVQIPTSDSVPIEITNGLKVSGKRYVSNTIGCSNKWSIVESPLGLYFIDNETNSLYLFNGLINSLSDKLGLRLWISDNNSHDKWNPVSYNNFRGFYDKNNDDVYFTNSTQCLCYSELIGLFTSFMSYEKVPAMFNIASEFYSFNKNKLWENFAGEYNMFYDEFKPYSITVISNPEEPNDKIFNTVEFRSDSWDGNTLLNNTTFDTLEVWNEYQYGITNLNNTINRPSSLKKKFRVWRANVPRSNVNNRDRIRNTWAYIKLGMNTPNTYKTLFHDMLVHYFI